MLQQLLRYRLLEIVISAGQLTGSITVSTTEDLDDDLVEILEPVVFTFGIITNATSDITEIILNLESDDDPTITAIGTTGGLTSQAEGGSFELTASINSVSSKDATIPLTFLGDAIFDEDYTVNFDSKGEETQILDLQTSSYGRMLTFPDGRIAFKDWSTLRIYDPVLETLTSHYIGNDAWGEDYQIANNTHIYVKYNTKLTKVDITDLNAITYETIVNTGNLNSANFSYSR